MSPAPRKTRRAQVVFRDSPSSQLEIYILGYSTFVALSSHLLLFVTTITTADFVIVLHSARKVNILEIRISVMTEKYPSERRNEFQKNDMLLTVPVEFTEDIFLTIIGTESSCFVNGRLARFSVVRTSMKTQT